MRNVERNEASSSPARRRRGARTPVARRAPATALVCVGNGAAVRCRAQAAGQQDGEAMRGNTQGGPVGRRHRRLGERRFGREKERGI